MRADPGECVEDVGTPEDVVARVDLADGALAGCGVAVLDDALGAAVDIADDSAVAGGVLGNGGQDGAEGLGLPVLGAEFSDDFRGQEGFVAHDDQEIAGEAGECLLRRGDGVTGAELLGLSDPVQILVGEGLLDGAAHVTDDDGDVLDARRSQSADDVRQHRTAAHLVEHLGPRGFHARALACGEDERPKAADIALCACAHHRAVPLSNWLPGEDSNLEWVDQNHLCYHYTTR